MSAYLDYLVQDYSDEEDYCISSDGEHAEETTVFYTYKPKTLTLKKPKSFKQKKVYRPKSENPNKFALKTLPEQQEVYLLEKSSSVPQTIAQSEQKLATAVSFSLRTTECFRMNWRQEENENYRLDRIGAAVTDGFNGRVYIHGGVIGGKGVPCRDLFSYDVDAQTWQNELVDESESPALHGHHMLAIVGKHLYIFAGQRFYIYQNALMGDEEVYVQTTQHVTTNEDSDEEDTKKNSKLTLVKRYPRSWRSFIAPTWDQATRYSFTAVTNGYFVFGGTREATCTNTFQKYTITAFRSSVSTDATTLPTKYGPSPRCDHAAAVINQNFYVFGGVNSSGYVLNDLYRYDIKSQMWDQIQLDTGVPPAVFSHTMVSDAAQRYLTVFGGINAEQQVQNTLYRYDTLKNEWQLVVLRSNSTEQAPIMKHAMVTGSDSLIVIGGVSGVEELPNNHMSVLEGITDIGTTYKLGDYMASRFTSSLACDIALRTSSEEDTTHHEYVLAHKSILAARCEYFTVDTLNNALEDGNVQLPYINFDKYHTNIVRAFVHFLYCGSLPKITDLAKVQELLELSQELDAEHHKVLKQLCSSPKLNLFTTKTIMNRLESDLQTLYDCCEGSIMDMQDEDLPEEEDFSRIIVNPDLLFADSQIQLISPVDGQLLNTMPGHKIMLCRSQYIDDAFKSGMEESLSGKIKFSELSLEGMLSVLRFMYTSQVVTTPENCIEVFIASLLFGFPELTACSRSMVARHLSVDTAVAVLQIAQLYDDAALKRVCIAFIVRHFEIINAQEGWELVSLEDKQLTEYKYLQNLKRKLRKQKKVEMRQKKSGTKLRKPHAITPEMLTHY